MTNNQENKNSMYYAVIRKCMKFEEVWKNIPAFSEAFEAFNSTFKAIQEANQNQMINIAGATEAKQKEEDEMIAKTLEVASSVYAYASLFENHELKRMVDFSPSSLKKMSDTELNSMCRLVSKTASKLVKELAHYGISVEDIKELDQEIVEYENIVMEPREALTTRAKATAQMKALFPKADKLLKERLDKLMVLFKTKAPDFYAEYLNSRKIIDLGTRHQSQEAEMEA